MSAPAAIAKVATNAPQAVQATPGFFDGVKNAASAAGAWFGRTVSNVRDTAITGFQKVRDFAAPHIEKAQAFVQANKREIGLVTIGLAIGAIAYALMSALFCRGATPATTTPTSLATSAITV